MSSTKQIKWKISSVGNIKKMTRALEVVSTVKMQNLKDKSEKYIEFLNEFLKLINVTNHKVPIFINQPQTNKKWKTLLIVVWSEKWLCWTINAKLFKKLYNKYINRTWSVEVYTIGKKAYEYFSKQWFSIIGDCRIKDSFANTDLDDIYNYVTQSIKQDNYDDIRVCYNYFVSPMQQQPIDIQLFPLNKDVIAGFIYQITSITLDDYITDKINYKELIMEPSQKELQKVMQKQFVKHLLYWSILQNKTWEHASRMIAMKNAKDNASDMIGNLTLQFNKARQWAITQEISEIVSAKIALE